MINFFSSGIPIGQSQCGIPLATSHLSQADLVGPDPLKVENSFVLENVPLVHLPTLDLKILGSPRKPIKCLMLHGGPGLDCSYFLPFLAPLQQNASLLFYTQGSSGALTMQGLLRELEAIFKLFKNDEVIVFAHSFGAALIFEYIKTYGSDSVTALVLSSWIYDTQWIARYFSKFPNDIEESYKTNDAYKAQMLKIADRYFTSFFVDRGKRIFENIKYNAALSNAIWQESLADFDGRQVVRDFKKPILSLSGADDLITDSDYVHSGASLNANIQEIQINNAGHFPFAEREEDFNEAVRRFIESCSKQRRSV
ncbi:MAG: alpha/beta hydrolase [Deltaproteobacteria bacterium]|nr:alpha/beta hydrolase [Deltaproteobacteria bacterium]